MSVRNRVVGTVLAVCVGSASMAVVVAQDAKPQEAARPASAPKPITPLKITVVISRYQGEKKTASLPFTLSVNANDRGGTSLRMSENLPVPQVAVTDKTAQPVMSYSYRSLGTNIDTSAESLDESRFSVSLAIEDSQIFSDTKAVPTMAGVPSFQQFNSSMKVILRDGQTTQYTTATDKITGEVIKVDVTLNVIR